MHAFALLLFASTPTFTVDPHVQEVTEAALKLALGNANVSGGFVIVGDPNDGRILAVAAAGAHSDPLHETIVPASLAKTIVIASALEHGDTNAEAMHDCRNAERPFGALHDWKAFGALSTSDTLVFSSNICALKVASAVGERGVREAFAAFGFSPAPTAGLSDFAVGALRVSALELLQAYGAIANGGELLAPRSATDRSAKVVLRRVLSEKTAGQMRNILSRVVSSGTAQSVAASVPAVAGKTGTLEDGVAASFAGFAPADAPRIVALVYLDGRGPDALYGGSVAAPVFARISSAAFNQGLLRP